MTEKRTLEQIEQEIMQTKTALSNVKGLETEVYARIVGYYRSVRNWNCGKRDEYDHRKMFQYDATLQQNDQCCADSIQHVIHATDDVYSYSNNKPASYELFIRKTCPNCPPVKDFLSHLDTAGTIIDVDSSEGFSKATALGVFAAPTVIFYDTKGKELSRAHTTEELTSIFQQEMVLC